MPSLPPAFFVSLLLLPPLLLSPAGAAEYTVGDGTWDTGTNYASWAQKHAFNVGDVLVFRYAKSQHNVYDVTEGTYQSCDTSGGTGVLKTYDTGYDRVELTVAKTYWFICDIPGHCIGGMKVAVNVSAGAQAGAPSPSRNAASPAGGRRNWIAWVTLAFGVLLIKWDG